MILARKYCSRKTRDVELTWCERCKSAITHSFVLYHDWWNWCSNVSLVRDQLTMGIIGGITECQVDTIADKNCINCVLLRKVVRECMDCAAVWQVLTATSLVTSYLGIVSNNVILFLIGLSKNPTMYHLGEGTRPCLFNIYGERTWTEVCHSIGRILETISYQCYFSEEVSSGDLRNIIGIILR